MLLACGGDPDPGPEEYATFGEACAAIPGCGDAPVDLAGPREALYRVLVTKGADGSYSITNVERIDVLTAVGINPGPARGEVGLVGRDAAGEPMDGQLLAFPTVRSFGYDAAIPYHEEVVIEGATSMVGYVRADEAVADIAVVDADGTELASAPLPPPDMGGGSSSGLTAPAYCSHIQLITEGDDPALIGEALEGIQLARSNTTYRALVEAAIGRMPPLLCKGVSRIALVQEGSPGLVTASEGDLMRINVTEFLLGTVTGKLNFQSTVIHEATHATSFLLSAEGSIARDSSADSPLWSSSGQRESALTTIRDVRLEKGLIPEWGRMHQSFVDQGWAADYPSRLERLATRLLDEQQEALERGTDQEVAEWGVMSRYGATRLTEDIAEMVSEAIMSEAYEAAGSSGADDVACRIMRGHTGTGVPARYSALYTKLHFLKDLGLLTEEQVDRCTGMVQLEGTPPGFTFRREGSPPNEYTSGVDVALGIRGDYWVFQITASGMLTFGDMTYPATARLSVTVDPTSVPERLVSLPRGVYVLDLDNYAVTIEADGAPNFSLDVGYILVSESSVDGVAGSVYATGGTRFSVPPVDEVFDPPYVVNFAADP